MRVRRLIVAFVVVLALTGCGTKEDQITTYCKQDHPGDRAVDKAARESCERQMSQVRNYVDSQTDR